MSNNSTYPFHPPSPLPPSSRHLGMPCVSHRHLLTARQLLTSAFSSTATFPPSQPRMCAQSRDASERSLSWRRCCQQSLSDNESVAVCLRFAEEINLFPAMTDRAMISVDDNSISTCLSCSADQRVQLLRHQGRSTRPQNNNKSCTTVRRLATRRN